MASKKSFFFKILKTSEIVMLAVLFTVIFFLFSQTLHADTIKIGLIAPLSGDKSDVGQFMKNGAELATRTLNEDTKRRFRLELKIEDSRYSTEGALQAFNKLVNEGTHLIVGPYNFREVSAVAPLSRETKTILVLPGTRVDEVSDLGDYIFRVIHTISDEADFFARFVGVSMKSTSLHFLALQSPLTDSYIKRFQTILPKLGKTVGLAEKFNANTTDMRPQILRIRRQQPTDIFIVGSPKHVGLILRQAAEWKLKARFYSIEVESPELIATAGELANGIYFPDSYDRESAEPAVTSFLKSYSKAYNVEPNVVSATTFDAVGVLAECVERHVEKTEEVKTCLLQLKDYPGASGTFSINEKGDAVRSFVIKTVRDGKFVKVS